MYMCIDAHKTSVVLAVQGEKGFYMKMRWWGMEVGCMKENRACWAFMSQRSELHI